MSKLQGILDQLLEDKSQMQPFVADASSSYRDSLDGKLKDYVQKIIDLPDIGGLTAWLKSKTDQFNIINSMLIRSIDQYLSGSAGKAYDEIENLMELDIVKNSLLLLKKPLSLYKNDLPSVPMKVRHLPLEKLV